MNKIKFNEGGQPIHLDDLQLLQNNTMDLFKTVMVSLSGGAPVFFVRFPDTIVKKEDSGETTLMVKAGAMVVDGELVQWADTPVVGTVGDSIYACINEASTDNREFADGQHHDCRSVKVVTFSYSKEGAEKAYDMGELPVLSDLLGKVVTEGEWQYLPFTGVNGYEGYFRYRSLFFKKYVQINAKSQSREWSTNTGDLYGDAKAVFDTIPLLAAPLAKKNYEVRYKGEIIGKYHHQAHGAGAFTPARDGLRPIDCPIHLEIVL